MTTDFRALCAELLDEFVYHTDWSDAEELKERARAALADEPAEPPLYLRQTDIGQWEGADHPSGPWRKVLPADLDRWSRSTPAPLADTEQVLNLAAIIREVDGSNNKGAAALAESILDHPRFRAVLADEPPADGEVAELVAWLREQADHELGSTFDADYFSEDPAARNLNRAAELLTRARAALADEPAVPLSIADAIATAGSEYLFLLTGKTDQLLTPDLIENLYSQFHSIIAGLADNLSRVDEPAVPEGREPASVTGQPSDEAWDALVERAWDKYQTVGYQGERFMYDRDFGNALEFVRQGLTRWGNPAPQPPAEGEVAELVGKLVEAAPALAEMGWDQHAQRILRAADLLQRLSPPQPVPVSERLPGPGEMTEDGEVWVDDPGHDYPIADSGDYDWEPHKWIMRPIGRFDAKYGRRWLPAHALPVPGQEVEG